MFRFAFEAIGTSWEIDTREELGEALRRRILERIGQFDAIYSRFRTDSLVSRIASSSEGSCFAFPDEDAALFDLYDQLHERTHGAVDLLVGRDLELLGYDWTYSLQQDPAAIARHGANRPRWSRDVQRQSATATTERSLVIDVGAAGKGYLVDVVADLLRAEELSDFLIDGSGDLRHAGAASTEIGLEHRFDPGLAIGVAQVKG